MKHRLLWQLLLYNILPLLLAIMAVIWLTIDHLATTHCMELIEKYAISPADINTMVLASLHRFLIWAGLVVLVVATLASLLLTRRILQPLSELVATSKRLAAGDFSRRAVVHPRDEVGELGQAFNQLADSLVQAKQLRINMAADVAHGLRSPLTNMCGYLEALNDRVLPPSPAIFRILHQESLHLMRLVDNLQQLARAKTAGIVLNRTEVIPAEEVASMLELYRQPFVDKDISVVLDQGATRSLSADRDKILQVLRNLFDNCLRYTPAGGWVRVSTTEDGWELTVAFRNSGPGIAAADLSGIFERFSGSDHSCVRPDGGFGIGLSIVRQLVEAQGGRVGADSSANETIVWFALPLQSH